MSEISLNDRVVIMTGASRGLGRAMAVGLADAGARVVLASPEAELLDDVAGEIEARVGPGRALSVVTDITNQGDCDRLLGATLGEFGALEVLVNNARRPHRGPGLPAAGNSLKFWQSDPSIWQETIRVNVSGTFVISRTVAPHMIAQGHGHIINLSTSIRNFQGQRNSPYGVTKAAIEAETQIWAKDLEGTGVMVNSLLPGGSCDSDPNRPPRTDGRKLLPVDIMNPVLIWLVSDHAKGNTGGRYVGKLWDASLAPDEAAAKTREPPAFRVAAIE